MLTAVTALIVGFAAISLWLWQRRRIGWKSWLASALLVVWVAGVGIKVHFDRAERAQPLGVAALGDIAWPQDDPKSDSGAVLAAQPVLTEVAPVDSLVGGLEQRLAQQPDDAGGWALLAQSYAFMGDVAAADGALKKAIALGIDEASLRERVDGARREPRSR
jgi:predicted Zn-dependent protease